MKRIVEIRAAEGGADSQLFVKDLSNAYAKLFVRKGWKHRVVRERPSDAGYFEIAIEVSGSGLKSLDNEIGGHRIQRVPPTERRGRVHTSTVTVAVIDTTQEEHIFREEDFSVRFYSGTGKGGQKRNKVQSCVTVTHVPTGMSQNANGRSRIANEEQAKRLLLDRLSSVTREGIHLRKNNERHEQVGSGQRADKSVTIRFQDDKVSHHMTDKTMSATKYMRGFMDEVWQ